MLQSYGFSYVGLTQWALCDGDDRPDAMVVGLSSRRFDESIIYVGGGFAMETSVTWNLALHLQTRPRLEQLWGMLTAARTVRRASLTVPPEDAADVAVGRRTPLHHEWMRHDAPGDPWWDARRFAGDPSRIPPVTVLAGWQDLFLLGGFADFAALRSAGATVRLIAGDWTHHGDEAGIVAVRELLRQFVDPDAIAQAPGIVATPSGAPGPAVTAPSWPPTDAVRSWHLADGGVLLDEPSDDERIVSYRYDPADPTPQAGGRSLNPFQAGRRDQRPRERRDDVLVWTGQPSAAPMVLAGDASVELTVTSTNPRVDLFLRLCDVDAAGRSHSVADGYLRLPAPDGEATTPRRVVVPLGPVGHRLAAGHRLRLQVSSGAHPLHLRNPGTADPTHDASRLVASTQTVVVGGPDGAVVRVGVC